MFSIKKSSRSIVAELGWIVMLRVACVDVGAVCCVLYVLCAVCAVSGIICVQHRRSSSPISKWLMVPMAKPKKSHPRPTNPYSCDADFEFLYFCIPVKTTLAYKISHQVFFMQRWFHQKSQKGNLIFRFNTKFPRFLWSSDLISEIHVYLCVASINSGTNWKCKCELWARKSECEIQ